MIFKSHIAVQETNYWDDISGSYDKNYSSAWSLREDRDIVRILSSIKTTRSLVRVLDLGCGTGLGFKLVQNQFAKLEYVGVDKSIRMLNQAKVNTAAFSSEDTQIKFQHADVMSSLQDLGDAEFDIVLVLNATGSYIAKTRRLFRLCEHVLRPGGTAFLSFLNRYSVRRMIQHSFGSIKEASVSRGPFQSSLSVPAVTLTKQNILDRLNPLKPEAITLHYQSVLGGVWETDQSLKVEKLLRIIASTLGHTVNVLFRKRQTE